MAIAEPVSAPSSRPENSEEEEVCVWSGAFPCLSPSWPRLRGWGRRKPPFFDSAFREKGISRMDCLELLVSPLLP